VNHFNAKAIEVVAGLIVRDGRLLICQRSAAAKFPLKWEFPGGKVEPGEDPVEALRRELREELGIEIVESKEIARHVHDYNDMPPVELRFYQVITYQGEVKNLIFQQVVWAEPRNLKQFDFLEGDLPLIKTLTDANSGGWAV
ncbi:MAG: (deoxy)nucleoside triphosphate pyrophosphohydrolase, partial [Deltaproteobacteria bacterium]